MSAPSSESSNDAVQTAVKAAPPIDLLVTYHTRVVGRDGVTREATWSQKIHRRVGMVWLERVLPAALHDSQSHGHDHAEVRGHAGHAHDDAQNSPILVTLNAQGEVDVHMVQREKQRVIKVDAAHHSNVGYSGDWNATYWVVSPRTLQSLEQQGAPKSGVQHLRRVVGEQTITVAWDVTGQFPRLFERTDAHGTSLYRISTTRIKTPTTTPWLELNTYKQGDYSDLLD